MPDVEPIVPPVTTAKMGMSADDITSAIQTALSMIYPGATSGLGLGPWVQTFFPDDNRVIFRMSDTLYQQSYEISDDGAATLTGMPEKVTQTTDFEPVAGMSAWIDEDREITIGAAAEFAGSSFVPWEGPIFESGLYPRQVVDARSPGYIDSLVALFTGNSRFKNGHKPDPESALTGLDLGGCTKVWRKDEIVKGKPVHVLYGKGMIHRALATLLKGKPKVSIEIHDKDAAPRLGDIAIVKIPQVTRAEIVAAFSAVELETASMAGSRHTKGQMDKIQAIHDTVAEIHPPVCDPAMMSGSAHSKADKIDFHNLHDLAVKQGATCPGCQEKAGMSGDSEPKIMKPWQHLFEACRNALRGKPKEAVEVVARTAGLDDANVAAFSAAVLADVEPSQTPVTPPATQVVVGMSDEVLARFAALEADNLATKTKLEETYAEKKVVQEAALASTSANFARELCRTGKIVPASESKVALQYRQAAILDGNNGVAVFSATGQVQEGEAVANLRAMFADFPVLPYFSNDIGDRMEAPGDDLEGTESSANVTKMLAMTPLGREAIAMAKKPAAFTAGDAIADAVKLAVADALKGGGR